MSLRKIPVPQVNDFGLKGTVPAVPGTVIGRVPRGAVVGADGLTEAERELVEKAGWRPGEPLPDLRGTKIGKKLQAQVEEVRQEADDYYNMSPIDPSTPPLEPPEPVDIESLPPDEREKAIQTFREMDELQDRMNAMRKAKQQRAAQQAPAAVMSKPGAAQAIAVAQAAAAREQEDDDSYVEIVDDLEAERPQEAPHCQFGPFKLKEPVASPTQETPAPTPAPEPENSSQNQNLAGGNLAGTTTHCPRCRFDLNKEPVQPTQEDIVAYLAMLCEGTRFRKRVRLFGGRITVTFRSLLPKEVDIAIQQVDEDISEGKTEQNALAYVREAEAYKLAAGIEAVYRKHKSISLPELSQLDDSDPDHTPIRQLREYLDNEIFTSDSLRRVVGAEWVHFNELLQHLDAKATDPNFFGKAASQD